MKLYPFTFSALFTMSLAAAPDYSAILPKLDAVIRTEMEEWDIGGVALALFDESGTIHATGFGEAEKDSVFRVGSVSKLFNAIAVMQQVEKRKLDLDAALPTDLLPLSPFPGEPPVTLRQLLCHRSGLQREVAVGGYFDSSEPGLAATVGDLRSGVLVTRPGEMTRYSNVGASLAGFMMERAAGMDFAAYQQKHLLGPLGMVNSAWTLDSIGRQRVITSHMQVADGRGGWTRREAPLFDLGTIPAGNLFSTVEDIARFGTALLNNGGGLVKPATLQEMWTPQLTAEKQGFGIGFMCGSFGGHKAIGHNGAVYGHSTSFTLLPDKNIGMVVIGNEDIANGRIQSISHSALSLMLEAKAGEMPTAAETVKVDDLHRFAGDYESESYWARIEVSEGRLAANFSGQFATLTPTGPHAFRANSRIESDSPVEFQIGNRGGASGFTRGGQHFSRVLPDRSPLRKEWRALLGSYGEEFIPLIVTERHGHLYAMTENMVDYRLTPSGPFVCELPKGMYSNERVVFLPDATGHIHGINFANVPMVRRD